MSGRLGRLRGAHRDTQGQSLVEVALVLPLLLLLVLGMVDVGRIYALKVAVTNAAREAAIYAARDPGATLSGICQRARDEMGAGPAADPCNGTVIVVTCFRGGQLCDPAISAGNPYDHRSDGAGVAITVRYTTSLLTGYLVGLGLPAKPIVSATASAPGLSP